MAFNGCYHEKESLSHVRTPNTCGRYQEEQATSLSPSLSFQVTSSPPPDSTRANRALVCLFIFFFFFFTFSHFMLGFKLK